MTLEESEELSPSLMVMLGSSSARDSSGWCTPESRINFLSINNSFPSSRTKRSETNEMPPCKLGKTLDGRLTSVNIFQPYIPENHYIKSYKHTDASIVNMSRPKNARAFAFSLIGRVEQVHKRVCNL